MRRLEILQVLFMNGNNIKYKPEKLIKTRMRFTDDTVLTAAVTVGILRFFEEAGAGWTDRADAEDIFTRNVRDAIVRYAKKYPDAGYGGSFRRWVRSGQHQPYNSWGNGSAMRVSCCGWAAKNTGGGEKTGQSGRRLSHIIIRRNQRRSGCGGGDLSAARGRFSCRNQGNGRSPIMIWILLWIRSVPHYQFDVSCQGSGSPGHRGVSGRKFLR